ncbi:pheromone A receptor-domain-containing protein [Stachybotrys elegans]|uniref:Pheromone A receptor-domain-containing protein n=1 Tax=Stachybotrys elegans TaxID=80388 RepID=A0A8K0SYK8_9HYPO|nr:pheromone A receptor-domain-containing protein [Stachybotrys elegans]
MASPVPPSSQDGVMILALSSFDPPYATPALTANLVLRVILAVVANILCLVPLRLLYRNGELAAVVFIVNVELRNLMTICYSLLWRDNDMDNWWPGWGLCDLHPYIYNLSLALYSTCLLAIMRNLAHQVGLMRAHPLTVKEKRRRNLIQAFIMLPLPLVQLAFVWPLTLNRFSVTTVVGCTWQAYPAWPYLVFFVLGPVIVALLTTMYAILIYVRFRQVAQSTETALSSNQIAHNRAQRTKRRLYRMVIAILVPFLPIVCALAAFNIIDMEYIRPFDYDAIHNDATPFQWQTVFFLSTEDVSWVYLNNPYISIVTAIPIFLFFGLTKDAINAYRTTLLMFGLDRWFPSLENEYDPDRRSYGNSYMGSRSAFTTSGSRKTPKSATSSHELTLLSSTSGESSTYNPTPSLNFLTVTGLERTPTPDSPPLRPPRPPRPVYSPEPYLIENRPLHIPHRNPFIFRTRLDLQTPFQISFSKMFGRERDQDPVTPLSTLQPPSEPSYSQPWEMATPRTQVRTRVWSEDEDALCDFAAGPANHSTNGVMVETALTRESHHVG